MTYPGFQIFNQVSPPTFPFSDILPIFFSGGKGGHSTSWFTIIFTPKYASDTEFVLFLRKRWLSQ